MAERAAGGRTGASLEPAPERSEYDVEKLKIIEDAYRANEAKVRAIIDESQDMIVTCDGEGRIIDLNKAGVRLLGIGAAEKALGRPQSEFWANASDHEIFLRHITEEGFVKDFEVIMKRQDGATLFCLESATLIRSRGGAPQEIHAIVKDISERIRDEQALWNMNIELAEANRKLKESQIMMVQQEKLASIGQLAAGIAHEINNPLSFLSSNHSAIKRSLAAIKEFLALVRERGGPEVETERGKRGVDGLLDDLEDIMKESDDGYRRITNIVQNLRNFSRIDSSEQFAPADINKGIQDTLAVARNELKYVAEVTTRLGDLPPVECVSGHINQVLLNLLVNAAQAIKSQSRKEMGSITVSTGVAGDRAWIEIADDGPGIQKGHQLRIFDPFFTTKPVGQGTGLGLSISYDIVVNKHRGALTVRSEPGHGACFRIELPVRHPAPAS
jgi:two-component system, NtrC family, sensor kinase